MEKARKIQIGWSAFLWSYLNAIANAMTERDYNEALKIIEDLMSFLPPDTKKDLEEEEKKVKETRRKFEKMFLETLNHPHSTPYDAGRAVYNLRVQTDSVAYPIVKGTIERIIEVLDKKGYLEVREKRMGRE